MTKRVIITGASSGIGATLAPILASAGCQVILVARRKAKLLEVATECGGLATICEADVTDVSQIAQVVQTARGSGYPVLINNAGIADFGDSATMPWDAHLQILQTNLIGPYALTHAFLPWALERGGQIVNVLSITAKQVFPGSAAYSSAKVGLGMLGAVLSQEYRKAGLRVTNVFPGAIDTPIWDSQGFIPRREDMIPVTVIASQIANLVLMPTNSNIDELVINPPRGVL